MGKLAFTKPQQIVSVYYFGHRESEDLDFFTEQDLPRELVQEFVSKTASKHKLKFNLREIDPVLMSEACMKIEDFTVLPKMLVPLTLSQLRQFFKQISRKLAKSFTK